MIDWQWSSMSSSTPEHILGSLSLKHKLTLVQYSNGILFSLQFDRTDFMNKGNATGRKEGRIGTTNQSDLSKSDS